MVSDINFPDVTGRCIWVSTFHGMEWWNGMVEWNGGMEWWNGMVEGNSGMDYWNGGMLPRTYLIIQYVLFSEQRALRCVLCMHCWLDGWLARLYCTI